MCWGRTYAPAEDLFLNWILIRNQVIQTKKVGGVPGMEDVKWV